MSMAEVLARLKKEQAKKDEQAADDVAQGVSAVEEAKAYIKAQPALVVSPHAATVTKLTARSPIAVDHPFGGCFECFDGTPATHYHESPNVRTALCDAHRKVSK